MIHFKLNLYVKLLFQAIQDITRSYEVPPEEIVTLIYEKIDVNGEGKLMDIFLSALNKTTLFLFGNNSIMIRCGFWFPWANNSHYKNNYLIFKMCRMVFNLFLSSQVSWRWRSSSVERGSILTSWKCSLRWWILLTSWKSSSTVSKGKLLSELGIYKQDYKTVPWEVKSRLLLHVARGTQQHPPPNPCALYV